MFHEPIPVSNTRVGLHYWPLTMTTTFWILLVDENILIAGQLNYFIHIGLYYASDGMWKKEVL